MDMRNEAARHKILTLEDRIEETKAAHANHLRKARDLEGSLLNLQRERSSLKNHIAPISSLPNEILSAIFEEGHRTSPPLRTSPGIEIVLSHINQRFRDVAMNTQTLWTRIAILICTPFDKVITYLQRSGTSPFDIHIDIDIDTNTGSGSDTGLHSESDALLYTSAEWQSIMFHLAHCRRFSARCNKRDVIEDLINKLHPANAPLLQSLRIEHFDTDFDFEPYRGSFLKIVEGGAPTLTLVQIKGCGLDKCLPPLSAVTSLTLMQATRWITWSELRDILGGLPLTRLVIGDTLAGELIPNNLQSSIILASLLSLQIYIMDSDAAPYPVQILLAISAPALEFLAIDQVVEQDLEDISGYNFRLQISDRFPCLRCLSVSLLSGLKVSQELWTSFCSVFPRITHFALGLNADEVFCSKPLIATLGSISIDSASSMVPLALPELHTLSVGQLCTCAAASLCDFVSARDAVERPLRSLHLPKHYLHDETFVTSLDLLREYIEVTEYQLDERQLDDGVKLWNGWGWD